KRKFKVWLATNEMPSVARLDPAIVRRLQVVPFAQIPDELVDLNFLSKWQAKQDVVLKWLVEGAIDFYKNKLSPPVEVKEFTAEILEEMSSCVNFIKESLVFSFDPEKKMLRKDLYQSYRKWASEEGIYPDTDKGLFAALRSAYPRKYLS